jgi:hypothetical protein
VRGGSLCPTAQEEENQKERGTGLFVCFLAKVGDCEQRLGLGRRKVLVFFFCRGAVCRGLCRDDLGFLGFLYF